jgi:hypothetical protein
MCMWWRKKSCCPPNIHDSILQYKIVLSYGKKLSPSYMNLNYHLLISAQPYYNIKLYYHMVKKLSPSSISPTILQYKIASSYGKNLLSPSNISPTIFQYKIVLSYKFIWQKKCITFSYQPHHITVKNFISIWLKKSSPFMFITTCYNIKLYNIWWRTITPQY